jgi:hypothetical protein
MRKLAPVILLAGASAMLAACGAGGGVFNPLVVPPEFTLTPPAPGAPRPAEGTASDQALEALFGGPAPRSRIEASVIDRAGSAAPSIRSTVGDTATNTVAKGRVTRDIIAAPEGDGQSANTVIPS